MKKIMTVVLALAVIFGFAACSDGSTVSFYGEDALSISVASAPEYIVGQTLNPDDITLRVVYDQGSDKTFKASELGIKPATDKTFKLEADNTFYVVYGRDDASTPNVKENEWPITIKATELTKLVIDTTNAAKEYNGTVLDVSNLVYTAELANGKKVPVTAAVAHEIADFKFDISKPDEGKVTVSLKKTSEDAAAEKVEFSAAWTLTVAEMKIKSVEITQDPAKEVFRYAESGNTIADVTYLITIEYENGVKKPAESATSYSPVVTDTETSHVLDKQYTVAVQVTIDGEKYVDSSVTIAPTEDYVKVFDVQHKLTNEKQYEFTPGNKITMDKFTFTVEEWASGHTYEEGEDKYDFEPNSNDFTVTPNMVPEGWNTAEYSGDESEGLVFKYAKNPEATMSEDSITSVKVKLD